MTQVKSEKMSFVAKVIDFLKGGDEGKVQKFQKYVVKELQANIKARKEAIEELKDKINDANDTKNDYLVGINVDKLSTTDSTKAYASCYISGYIGHQQTVANIEEQISLKEEEIKAFESMLEDMQ